MYTAKILGWFDLLSFSGAIGSVAAAMQWPNTKLVGYCAKCSRIHFVYCKLVPSVYNIHMMTILVSQIFIVFWNLSNSIHVSVLRSLCFESKRSDIHTFATVLMNSTKVQNSRRYGGAHSAKKGAAQISGVHVTHEERAPIIDGLGRAPPRPVRPGI